MYRKPLGLRISCKLGKNTSKKGNGRARALAEKFTADAADAGFDPDIIEYETGKAALTLIREAMGKRGGR